MSFKDAVISAFKNYANFNGRARRSEYWYFSLFSLLIVVIALIVGAVIDEIAQELIGIGLVIIGLYMVATIIPNLSVTCRRLHDIGKSGAYMFFIFLPIVGEILVWVWSFQDGQPWANQYGEDPKGRNMTPFDMGYPSGYSPVSGSPVRERSPRSSSPRKKCAECGSEIDSDASFCPVCGHDTRMKNPKNEATKEHCKNSAKPTTICANCGRTIDMGSVFCPFCGKSPNKIKNEDREVSGASKAKTKGFSAPTDLD